MCEKDKHLNRFEIDFYLHFHSQLLEKIFVFSWESQKSVAKKCISHIFHKILLEL